MAQQEITADWLKTFKPANMSVQQYINDLFTRQGQANTTPYYLSANSPYLAYIPGADKVDLAQVGQPEGGRLFLDDLYDAIKSGGGSSSGGEEGSASVLPGGGTYSQDAIEQFLLTNPAMAQQMWELTQKYQPLYAQLARDEASKDRTSDLGDVTRLMPELRGIYDANMRPEEKQLRDLLFSQITGELQAGSALTPELSRDVEQGLRSAEFARGIGGGQGSANRESVRKALEGLDLLNSRQEKAKSLISMEAATKPDPFAAILGRPTTGLNTGSQQAAVGNTQLSPSYFADNAFQAANLNLQQQNFDRTGEWRQQMIDMMKTNPALSGLSL